MPWVDHRKNSRVGWGKDCDSENNPSREDIQMGAMLRIADATEAMAKRHTELMTQRDYYERLARDRGAEVERLVRQRAALRGVVTRLKRSQAAGNG